MINILRTSIILYVALSMLSCSGNVSERSTSIPDSSITEDHNAQTVSFTASEEDLFSLLSQWQKTQNTGDFQAYSNLYDNDFQGVKRSGDNVFTFDRKNWLQDRSRMFQKPMTVDISEVKILMAETPYRIIFKQGWSNDSYSDFGSKLLSVKSLNGQLKIVKEEMMESFIADTKNDANNAMNNGAFYVREGNYVYIPIDFSNAEFLRKDKVCDDRWHETHCVDVSYFNIDSIFTQTPLDSVISQNIFIGYINSDSAYSYTITGWRATSKSLRDSLPGITHPSSIFERQYSWVGGNEYQTPLSSALFFDGEKLPIERGQWAFISSRKPLIYRKKEISDELKEVLVNQTREGDVQSYSLDYFEGESQSFVSTYEALVECGEEFYENIKLWQVKGETLFFIKDLPDLPVSILDLDGDDNLDLLYYSNFEKDPSTNIWWESPYFAKRGDDTVFLSCGC